MQIIVDLRLPPGLTDAHLARAPQIVRDEIRRTVQGDLLLLEGEISQRAGVGVTGTMRGATATELRGTGVEMTGRVYNPTLYAPAVDAGGRAHWAPLANIQRWAARVIGGPNAMRIGRAIWVSIAKRGTKAHPFWSVSLAAKRGELERRHTSMLARLGALLGGHP